ncbi:hypothetical protein [Flavobacterium sp.]|jgi:thymidylate kinase|uniref:hypothetical protein n=1 Tax=Flavobacterium sp. TaxID=239 RepID=UPI0022BEB15C|nr:hypothetical protein [Flavobacterium sp.]MCZ8145291.1 hypothetical protein [Flavobacterium sp.]MCZ8366830.1 hypothetical protein [Flavobacterium sp.]
MEKLFEKAGYRLTTSPRSSQQARLAWLQINNPDGTPRWLWNASNKKPIFLKFYNVGSFRAFVFMIGIRLVFLLRLQHLIFKKNSLYIESIASHSSFDYQQPWALFTGTVGPNNKTVVYNNQSFIKIAQTPQAEVLLSNELNALMRVQQATLPIEVPKVLHSDGVRLTLSDVSKNGTRFKKLDSLQLEAILALNSGTQKTVNVEDWTYFNDLKSRYLQTDTHLLPKNLVRKINILLDAISPHTTVSLALSHGDFTQWNMYKKGNHLAIYDWELASTERPIGFDFFHLIFQNSVLVHHHPWKTIHQTINEYVASDQLKALFHNDPATMETYLRWYLLINTMEYLLVYAQQPVWHIQVHWLLTVWNQALNAFLASHYSHRQLLIMDVFDFLQYKEYAVLKFHQGYPESLSLNSDIDLILKKATGKELLQFLKHHHLLIRSQLKTSSFMINYQGFTADGELLSLDLIWQVKRKSLQLLDCDEILAHRIPNSFGVSLTSAQHTTRFVALFYRLNHASIPEKYISYSAVAETSNHPLDVVLYDYFEHPDKSIQPILNYLFQQPYNRSWKRLRNVISYFFDCVRKIRFNSGFVITFSGVDGAGKTTVIDNIAVQIEKQLRKPVVILRHRPSILPILSVWVKGKDKAQQEVLSSLPRQGNNTSVMNSMFRFGYYYLDYILGQFVIQFKYCLRGYVVIYDRYYFDFINDSKRSNLVLPQGVAKLGYRLLLKPKFNFFLYADPETILQRKKELDFSTIQDLTQRYRQLFHQLQGTSETKIYKSILNEDLNRTTSTILKTLVQY